MGMENSIEDLRTEESIDDGLGLLIKQKRLYHGSATKGIEHLNPAEETTVGEGIYFTSEVGHGLGYAKARARNEKGSEPIVYSAQIENLKFLDLRSQSNVLKILEGFKQVLLEYKKKTNLSWSYEAVISNAIEAISKGQVKNLKQITFSTGKLFTEYCKSLGYDGLITFEGGEGNDIGEHDTYLIFDPETVKSLTVEGYT